jgi:predicted acetyltransferase
VRYPFPLDFDHDDFPKLLQRIQDFKYGVNLPEGWVPSTTYWLVEGKELVGVSNLRAFLNDKLRHVGGHIGLGVRPSMRGRGLGKLLLGLTMDEARKQGLTSLCVHCYKDNLPSARMIMAAGGVLDSEVHADGSIVQRYLIGIPETVTTITRGS